MLGFYSSHFDRINTQMQQVRKLQLYIAIQELRVKAERTASFKALLVKLCGSNYAYSDQLFAQLNKARSDPSRVTGWRRETVRGMLKLKGQLTLELKQSRSLVYQVR